MRISIIVPVYNVELYIRECLDSLISQTYENIEIIIIDDGSTDLSYDICKEYNDKRIKLIQQKNKGVSMSRNLGLKESTGEYVMFVDSDDFLEIDACSKLVEILEKNNLDVLMFNYNNYIENKKYENKNVCESFICDNKYIKNKLIYTILNPKLIPYKTENNKFYGMSFIWNKIFKRKILFDNHILFEQKNKKAYFEDGVFCLDVFNNSNSICFTKTPLYNYRQINTSASKSYNSQILETNDYTFECIKKFDDNTFEFRQAYYGRVIRNFRVALEIYFFNKEIKIKEVKKTLKKAEYKEAFKKIKYKYLTPKLKVYKLLINLKLIDFIYLWYKIER